jgi:hypothetical protein
MEILLKTRVGLIHIEELKLFLEENLPIDSSEFELKIIPPKFRDIDPTILSAIVGTAGTILGAFITTLLPIAKKTSVGVIVLQTKDGKRIEFPSDTPPDKIDDLVKTLNYLDDGQVTIYLE